MGKNQPNILFIMGDQFRASSLSGMGDGIRTPNIDRIRKNGMFLGKPPAQRLYAHPAGLLSRQENIRITVV